MESLTPIGSTEGHIKVHKSRDKKFVKNDQTSVEKLQPCSKCHSVESKTKASLLLTGTQKRHTFDSV